jgi:hypothetical protein
VIGVTMAQEWRLIQLFLPPADAPLAVYEVEMESTTRRVRCNCPTYVLKATCKHERLVKARIKNNEGQYPLALHVNASKENSKELFQDRAKFREFIIKYGQIEVL